MARIVTHNNQKYYLFWDGILSNWHPSVFTIHGITYTCAEQCFMYNKARYFDDMESAQKIINADHPREQKRLGRKVKNFNQRKALAKHQQTVKTSKEQVNFYFFIMLGGALKIYVLTKEKSLTFTIKNGKKQPIS